MLRHHAYVRIYEHEARNQNVTRTTMTDGTDGSPPSTLRDFLLTASLPNAPTLDTNTVRADAIPVPPYHRVVLPPLKNRVFHIVEDPDLNTRIFEGLRNLLASERFANSTNQPPNPAAKSHYRYVRREISESEGCTHQIVRSIGDASIRFLRGLEQEPCIFITRPPRHEGETLTTATVVRLDGSETQTPIIHLEIQNMTSTSESCIPGIQALACADYGRGSAFYMDKKMENEFAMLARVTPFFQPRCCLRKL